MNKKGIEMGFNWIFALIAGGAILFIAIYSTTLFIKTGEQATGTETAAQIISLLDPLETGIAEGKSVIINFRKETKLNLECNSLDNRPFGRQTISFSEKSIGDDYGQASSRLSIKNKYVFSSENVEGKNVYIFSKPFNLPFKVADIMIIDSKDYCFVSASEDVKNQIQGLNIPNIQFVDKLDECKGITVCFDSKGCDISVYGLCFDNYCESPYDYGRILKGNKEVYFVGNLLYAGIFSDKPSYECNFKRLLNKFNELSSIYVGKNRITEEQCTSAIDSNLLNMQNNVNSYVKGDSSLVVVSSLYREAKDIDNVNSRTSFGCKLY